MQSRPIEIRELGSSQDLAFEAATDLYIETFPKDERQSVQSLRHAVEFAGTGHAVREHFIVAECGDELLGFAYFRFDPANGIGFLVYVAVARDSRKLGVGTGLWESMTAILEADVRDTASKLAAVVLECERVEDTDDPSDRTLRQERLAYFGKKGAKIICDSYTQPALAPKQASVPLNLLAICFEPISREALIRGVYSRFWKLPDDHPYVVGACAGPEV